MDGINKLSHARTHGCLHLIDLAGSERVGKSGAEGQQLLEAQHINKSLRWMFGVGWLAAGPPGYCRHGVKSWAVHELTCRMPSLGACTALVGLYC